MPARALARWLLRRAGELSPHLSPAPLRGADGRILPSARYSLGLPAARQAGDWTTLARLTAVIGAYHLGYGAGSWRGVLALWWRRRPRRAGAA